MFSFHFVAEIKHSDLESLREERVPLVTTSGSQYILERSLDRNVSRSLKKLQRDAAFCLLLASFLRQPGVILLLLPQWAGTF